MVAIVLLARFLKENWDRVIIVVTYHVAVLIWWHQMGVFG